jgi:hypothetical protein
MPLADPSPEVRAEQIAVSDTVAEWSLRTTLERRTLTAPWIEVVYRKLDEAGRTQPELGRPFLRRAA